MVTLPFYNRAGAAAELARALDVLHGEKPLVLAIPREAVPMAKLVAEALGGEFDLLLVKKVGAPGDPQFAIGQAASIPVTGRTVVIVDDGLTIGAAMAAALKAVRAQRPYRLVCAIPVASREALALVQPLADTTVCLAAPVPFEAVSRYYLDFSKVRDDEVLAALGSRTAGSAVV